MPLAVGTKAPDFSLPTKTADGPKQIKLSDNFGKKNTLLLFFPMAFTGTCTEEMCSVGNGLREYTGLNCEVYGISGDNPFAQEAWSQKEKIGVTLLSDYEHKVARDYGVAYDSFLPQKNLGMAGVAKRSAFVIDKNGVKIGFRTGEIMQALANDGAQHAHFHWRIRDGPPWSKRSLRLAVAARVGAGASIADGDARDLERQGQVVGV